jgi:AraC family transcriptional regulator
LKSAIVASGHGWYVQDVHCTAGPQDRPFEEVHACFSLAVVVEGTFRYRMGDTSTELAPGAVMLGNAGCAFECAHEHAVGDRCLSFHFAPAYWQTVVASVPGVRHASFAAPRLPPLNSLAGLLADLEAARDEPGAPFEERGLTLAGAVLTALGMGSDSGRAPTARVRKRVAEVVRHIEVKGHVLDETELSLAALARAAAMSPYHFLRTFRSVVGMTPHQFVLRTRLNRAALQLRRSDDAIADIALAVGFNDLSNFNRRFRSLFGMTPGTFRGRRPCQI